MIKKVLHFEYCLLFVLTFIVYIQLDFSVWLFFLLLFVPDMSILGYSINSAVGAIMYNIVHSLVLPLSILILAIFFSLNTLIMIALIWLCHIFMDRFLGFGLKYKNSSFNITHMQKFNEK